MAETPFPSSPFPPAPPPPSLVPPPQPLQTPLAAIGSPFPSSGAPGSQTPMPIHSLEGMPLTIEEIVRLAFDNDYSDVHIGVGETPRFRHRGDIIATGWPKTDDATFMAWLREMLRPPQIDRFLANKELDAAFAFPFVRVRINLLDCLNGPALTLRLIPKLVSLEDLNLPAVLSKLAARPKGLVLVTGPTGSGKSTTLAAMIDWINHNLPRHIITIEDPIEFVHSSDRSLIRQRDVGIHTQNFDNALRGAMREDSDVILVGEIRDQETLTTALKAAQTGHLVLGTLHTNSAVRTVERVLGMVSAEEEQGVRRAVSESLLGVLSQGLLKSTDGKRTPFFDILVNTDACRDYIQQGDLDSIEEIMTRSGFDGMMTANQSLLQLVEKGRVTAEEALGASLRPNELSQALRGGIN